MISKTLCATGHRPEKFPWFKNGISNEILEKDILCIHFKKILYEKLKTYILDGYDNFIVGMALGFDTYFAEAILLLKNEFPNIKLEAAVPCFEQESVWKDPFDKERYFSILKKCDSISTVTKDRYKAYYMTLRNEYMVDKSIAILASYNGTSGGTRNCLSYALDQKQILEISNIHPETFEISRLI